MSTIASVVDGQIVESASQSSLSKVNSASSDMDKDSFLQLLVAQMKYQDPLEPTSNTEYISQYAQFSQVEQMQNMAATSELSRASALVGEYVYVKTTSSSGETDYVQGKVDYVVYENSKAYLSINEALYSLEDLDTVVDKEYMEAYDKAYEFTVSLNKLPGVSSVELTDAEDIEALDAIYQEMSAYEKQFVASETVDRLDEYTAKLLELKQAAEEAKKNENAGNSETGANTEAGSTEGTEEV